MLITSVPDPVLSSLHELSSQIPSVGTSIVPTLQMSKLRHRVTSRLHTGGRRWQSQDLNLGPWHLGCVLGPLCYISCMHAC